MLGNRYAVYGSGDKTLMLAGHMDEIGFIVSYIDEDGFLFFEQLGGHDNVMLPGRRVAVITKNGYVFGVTGKRAVHLMDAKERKEVPETHQVWIDIGRSRARRRKSSSESATPLCTTPPCAGFPRRATRRGRSTTGRGAIACSRLSAAYRAIPPRRTTAWCRSPPRRRRSARAARLTAAYGIDPQVGLAVDVDHATDFPTCDRRRFGHIRLGKGPVISRGPNINPKVFERLAECAEREGIPYQIGAESRPTGTDARVIQMTRGGVATGLLGIPLRYMHTPSEVADLDDIEGCVRLIAGICKVPQKFRRFLFLICLRKKSRACF